MTTPTRTELEQLAVASESADLFFLLSDRSPGPAWRAVVPRAHPTVWIQDADPAPVLRSLVGVAPRVWRWRRGVGLDALRVPDGLVVHRTLTSALPLGVLLDLPPGGPVTPPARYPRLLAGWAAQARRRREMIERALRALPP